MDCPDLEMIERYVAGRLERHEAAGFRSHLESCASCRTRVAEAQENEDFLVELRRCTRDQPILAPDGAADLMTVDDAQGYLCERYPHERYHVVMKVGEGGSGQVFRALDTLLERLVAVDRADWRHVSVPSVVAALRRRRHSDSVLALRPTPVVGPLSAVRGMA